MAVDSHIIVEELVEAKWEFHQHFSTQETKAYCALSGLIKAANILGYSQNQSINHVSFQKLTGYDLENEFETLSLKHFKQLLNQLDPKTSIQPYNAIQEIAQKYQQTEHLQCINIVRKLCLPIQNLNEQSSSYRIILFYGY